MRVEATELPRDLKRIHRGLPTDVTEVDEDPVPVELIDEIAPEARPGRRRVPGVAPAANRVGGVVGEVNDPKSELGEEPDEGQIVVEARGVLPCPG